MASVTRMIRPRGVVSSNKNLPSGVRNAQRLQAARRQAAGTLYYVIDQTVLTAAVPMLGHHRVEFQDDYAVVRLTDNQARYFVDMQAITPNKPASPVRAGMPRRALPVDRQARGDERRNSVEAQVSDPPIGNPASEPAPPSKDTKLSETVRQNEDNKSSKR